MSVTIVRNPGQGDALFFPSGPISFSQLRSYFKESGSGTVSASELRRNTNTAKQILLSQMQLIMNRFLLVPT